MELQKESGPVHGFGAAGRRGALCALVCMFCLTAAGRAHADAPVRKAGAPAAQAPALTQTGGGSAPQALPALEYYPTDTLFTCAQRSAYRDGDMVLEVPRLGLCVPVQNGTDEAALLRGVGLYEVSPLPGTGNANVSLAGHRGAAGCEFYAIDTLQEGDAIYLTYNGWRYTYEWDRTIIVEPDDWSAIFCTDSPRVTLTSCHPKTGSTHRICAVASLVCAEVVDEA